MAARKLGAGRPRLAPATEEGAETTGPPAAEAEGTGGRHEESAGVWSSDGL